MQQYAFEVNGSSIHHACLGLGSAHHHEEGIPMVYSMSSSGSQSRGLVDGGKGLLSLRL